MSSNFSRNFKHGAIFITGIFVVTSAFAYSVKKGDTLSLIAEEHYGNWMKWQDIWKSNESLIKNPNLIYPGQKLTVNGNDAGEGKIGKNRLLLADTSKDFEVLKHSGLSQEWKMLPEQPWERFVFKKAAEVDPDGFDRRSRVAVRVSEKTTPSITVSSDRMAIQGEIVNARTEYEQIFLGEQVFIRAEEQLQVGTVYTVASAPQKIISKRDRTRVGFAYDIAGKIKVIGVRDGLFIGTVISAQKPIFRNNLLIPEIKPLHFIHAVPSANVIEASVMTTDFINTSMLGEQQLVILDVGTEDGVKDGMIFRHYLKEDPETGKTITTKDYLIESELMVLDTKDRFSIAIILQSRSILHADDLVLSLMDLKDFQKNAGLQTFIQDYDYTTPLDELDQMDDSQGLGAKENQELRQLEKVNPSDVNKAPGLGEEPAPNDLIDKSINTLPPKKKSPETAPEQNDSTLDESLAPPKESAKPKEAPKVAPNNEDLDAPEAAPTPIKPTLQKTESEFSEPVKKEIEKKEVEKKAEETPESLAPPTEPVAETPKVVAPTEKKEAEPTPTPAAKKSDSSDGAVLDVPTAPPANDIPPDLNLPPEEPSPSPKPKK